MKASNWILLVTASLILLIVIWWMMRGPNYTDDHALAAALSGDVQLLQEVLDARPSLLHARSMSSGASLLHLAVRSGSLPAVNLLIDHGLNPQDRDDRGQAVIDLLDPASSGKSAEVFQRLLEVGAEFDPERGGHLLLAAAYAGDLPLIELLLQHGVPITYRDTHERGVMHAAAAAGHRDVMDFLRSRDARLSDQQEDRYGITPGVMFEEAVSVLSSSEAEEEEE